MTQTKAQAQQEIDIWPLLEAAVRDALKAYGDDYRDVRFRHSARTRSSVIQDEIVHCVKQALASVPGVHVVTRRGLTTICYKSYLFKLKKLSKKLRPKNIPTRAVMAFLFQRRMSDTKIRMLPGMTAPTNVVLGYQPRGVELQNAGVYIVCPQGAGVQPAWDWQLLPAVSAPLRLVFDEGPSSESASQGEKRRRRVTAKVTPESQPKKEQDGTDPAGK